MFLSNVLSPNQPTQNQTPPAENQSEDTMQEEATPTEETNAPAQSTASPTDASQTSSTSAQSAPVSDMQYAQKIQPFAPVPKVSDAGDEPSARAAALRNVDLIRTRALIDAISPVNNAALQAVKSYLTPVEPKAAATEADVESSTRAKPAAAPKAA